MTRALTTYDHLHRPWTTIRQPTTTTTCNIQTSHVTLLLLDSIPPLLFLLFSSHPPSCFPTLSLSLSHEDDFCIKVNGAPLQPAGQAALAMQHILHYDNVVSQLQVPRLPRIVNSPTTANAPRNKYDRAGLSGIPLTQLRTYV